MWAMAAPHLQTPPTRNIQPFKGEAGMARSTQRQAANDAGNEAAWKATDETIRTGADILNMNAWVAERSVEQFSSMFGIGRHADQATQTYGRSMEVLRECGTVFGKSYQDIAAEYVNWAQAQFRTNLSAVSRLLQCRTPQELLAAQNQLFGENLALALTAHRRFSEISKDMSDLAAEKIAELAEHTQDTEARAA